MSKNITMGKWITKISKHIYLNHLGIEEQRIELLQISKKEYDHYMKTFYENLEADGVSPSSSESTLLYMLFKTVKIDTCNIYVTGYTLSKAAQKLDLQKRSVNKLVEGLVAKNILMYFGYGDYRLNPTYFFFGTEAKRLQCIKDLKEELGTMIVEEEQAEYKIRSND